MPAPDQPITAEPVLFGTGDDWGVVLRGRIITLSCRSRDDLAAFEECLRTCASELDVPLGAVIAQDVEHLQPGHELIAALGIPLIYARNGAYCDSEALDAYVDDPNYELYLELSLGGTRVRRERFDRTVPDALWTAIPSWVQDPQPSDALWFCVAGWNIATLNSTQKEQKVSSEGFFAEHLTIPLEECRGILLREYI